MSFPEVVLVLTLCLGLPLVYGLVAEALDPWKAAVGMGVAIWVLRPVTVLGHELGHALAVRWLAGRPATVVVGRPPLARFTLGKIQVQASLLPSRGVTFMGVTMWDPRGVPWRTRAAVSLAGPAADLLQLTGCIVARAQMGARSAILSFSLLVLAGVLALRIVTNLHPAPVERRDDRAAIANNDGHTALLALRHARQNPSASAPLGPASATSDTTGSIPPPTKPR